MFLRSSTLTSLVVALLLAPLSTANAGRPAVDKLEPRPDSFEIEQAHRFALSDFEEMRAMALDILKRCPPGKCYYIGLGRSPTPVMAILENLVPGSAKTVPLSINVGGNRLSVGSPHYQKVENEISAHLERFLPSQEELAGRKILVIDYVHQGGQSLISSAEMMRQQYVRRGAPVQIEGYAYGHTETLRVRKLPDGDAVVTPTGLKLHTLSMHSGRAELRKFFASAERFENQEYDAIAEYESYKPGKTNPKSLKPTKEYARYKAEVATLISDDKELVQLKQHLSRQIAEIDVKSTDAKVSELLHSFDTSKTPEARRAILRELGETAPTRPDVAKAFHAIMVGDADELTRDAAAAALAGHNGPKSPKVLSSFVDRFLARQSVQSVRELAAYAAGNPELIARLYAKDVQSAFHRLLENAGPSAWDEAASAFLEAGVRDPLVVETLLRRAETPKAPAEDPKASLRRRSSALTRLANYPYRDEEILKRTTKLVFAESAKDPELNDLRFKLVEVTGEDYVKPVMPASLKKSAERLGQDNPVVRSLIQELVGRLRRAVCP